MLPSCGVKKVFDFLAYISTMIGDMAADQIVILNMCGRGDKDLGAVLPLLEKLGRI